MRPLTGRPYRSFSALLAIFLGVFLAPAPSPADARDGIDVDTSLVAVADDDRCSLSEAINNANAGADTSGGDCRSGTRGPDNIILRAERFEVFAAYPVPTPALPPDNLGQAVYFPIAIAPPMPGRRNGLPVITSDITIVGDGAQIVRQPRAPAVRLFEVAPSGRLALEDLTLRGGLAHGGRFDTAAGGAVLVRGGRLEATRCRFVANAANAGGAIAVDGGSAALVDSWVGGNEAAGENGGGILVRGDGARLDIEGGGISVNRASRDGGGVFVGPLGDVAIAGADVNGNEAREHGGGMSVAENAGATLTESELSGNRALYGGGLHATGEGMVGVRLSEIAGNAAYSGGGIHNEAGLIQITDSEIADNEAYGHAGGGVYNEGFYITLVGSTVRGNRAVCGGGIVNAARYNEGVDVSLLRSTVSENHAECGAAGIYNGGNMTITASTIASNVTEPQDGWPADAPVRAGIVNGPIEGEIFGLPSIADPALEVVATIVADHTGGRNCYGTGIRSLGYNLENGSTCGFNAPGDVWVVDARLGTLADNGGPTLTQALWPDSPARDAIPRGDAGCGTALPTDQRGLPRPDPGRDRCDIGAYELQSGS